MKAETTLDAEPDATDPEDPKAEKPKAEDPKAEDPKAEEPKGEEPKGEEPKGEEPSTEEPEAEKGSTDDVRQPRWRRTVRALNGQVVTRLLVVVILVASVVTAGLQWHRADEADGREAERRQVGDSAGRFGQALLSYDHTRLKAARDKVLALSSDDFAKTYDQAFTGGLEGIITKLRADATATVRNVYVADVDGGNARAVVVMDSEVRSTAGTRSVLGSYLDMKLTRSHGTWKVTEVTSIGAANESMTDPNGKQETTPTQPDASPSPGD